VIVHNLIVFLFVDLPGLAQAFGRAVHYGDKQIRENIPSETSFLLGNKAAEN